MTDGSSTIFVELTKDSFVGSELDDREFNGEILPPQLTSSIAKAPRARMRELASFELFTDRADTAIFVDRYAMMHERTRLREQILTGTDFARTSGAQVLMRLSRDQNVGQAALWQYDTLQESWERIGGITSGSSEPDIDIFSVVIFETGLYTIWDEDPAPEFSPSTDPSQVQLVEQSPFPSVEPSDDFFESSTVSEEETPFLEGEDDTLLNQPIPATIEPLNFSERDPIGLIPAVGLSGFQTEIEPTTDTTPANQFSEEFLETIESPNRSAAPTEAAPTPVGATLPSTGAEDTTINWINYLVFVLLLGVIGGSIYVIRQRPY